MIVFLLKSAGIIALFLVIYKLFLERDTYFKGIRMYFLAGLFLSFVVPFISITKYIEAAQISQVIYSQNFQNFTSNPPPPFDWSALFINIYIFGVALSGLYFVFQLFKLFKILNTHPTRHLKNLKIIETTKDISPFSFFNYIVYNPTQFTKVELIQLLRHEQAHVLQKHSIDMLLAYLLTCVQWFNPFAWFYKKAVNQNLEYIADRKAKFTIAPKDYSYLLLKTTSPNYQMVLANNYYNSLLKKRIAMLHKNHSPRLKQLKLALIVPLLVGFVFTFNTEVVAQQKVNKDVSKIDLNSISVTIDKDADKKDFAYVKKIFKKYGFEITFNKVKRNAKNEIIQINVSARGNKTTAQYATKGNNPILPIEFKRDFKNNALQIGATTPLHKPNNINSSYSYTLSSDSTDDASLVKLNNILSKRLSNVIFIRRDSLQQVKGKSNASLFTKQRGNVSATWIDDKGNKTDIIEVKKDGNVTKIIEVKTDKNGTISKTARVNTDKKDNLTKIVEVSTDGKPSKSFIAFKIGKDGEVILVKDFKNISKDDNDTIIKSNQKAKKELPIYFLNGKEITSNQLEAINTNTIKSVSVLKGKATDIYGEKAKNGVILISTKKRGQNKPKKSKSIIVRTDNSKDIDASEFNDKFIFNTNDGTPVLFVVDGKIYKKGLPKRLKPDTIKSVIVLKGLKAIKKYGRKGRNGVIEITTKKKVKK